MNYWLILGLAIVAMVATVVVFMWWWTTENWDWASAELKPPRTVPQEPGPVTVARRLAHHWQMLETLSDLSEIQTEQRKKLEQRVAALEREMGTDDPTRWTLRNRIGGLEQQIGVLQRAATLSPPTASPTTGSPSDAAEQESIPPESLASSRSDQRIIVGGRVGRALKSAQETDVPT